MPTRGHMRLLLANPTPPFVPRMRIGYKYDYTHMTDSDFTRWLLARIIEYSDVDFDVVGHTTTPSFCSCKSRFFTTELLATETSVWQCMYQNRTSQTTGSWPMRTI